MKTQVCIGMMMLLALGLGSAVSAAGAELRLSTYFSDNMVLQRNKPVGINGQAAPGATVTVTFAGQKKAAKADNKGAWQVELAPLKASSEPATLTVTSSIGNQKSEIKNVLVGDVWFFGRQTYVDISLGRNAEGRAAAAKYRPAGDFRAMVIKTIPAETPQNDLNPESTSGWMRVDQKNALAMSAAAFYLGADLAKKLDVPVGIVDVNMDRYFGIGWLSDKALADIVTMYPKDKEISWLPNWMREQAQAWESGKAQKDLDDYYAQMVKKNPAAEKPSLGLPPLRNPMFPSAGYNAVIHPLKHVTFKGILLQLGNDYPFIAYDELEKEGKSTVKVELDAAWGDNYVILKNGYRVTPVTLPYVPGDWRRTFGDETLPIGLVLPPSSDLDVYAAHNREIRELHRRTAADAENIGLILPGMDNIPSSGQPANDKLLAQRCEDWVLGAVCGKKGVTATGPLLDRVDARLDRATVYFKEGTADGLKATGEVLNAFETAGPDREFTSAKARIDGSTIKLKSDGPIQFVRFNWNGRPEPGLINSANLPALPFSTDADWTFGWIPPPEEANLPEEYHTTADKWEKSDVAIINGQIDNMPTGDSEPIPRRPGPLGIIASPFGPNIYVVGTDPGTPADGKLMRGDVIYAVNGKTFSDAPGVAKDQQYKDLSAAITYSESEEGQGKLVVSIRRGKKLMDVTLQLQVLGSYSSTTPYYCEKSQNIVKNAEKWMADRYRPASGLDSEPTGMLNTDLLFLLATGDPEYQGIVRRAVYDLMKSKTPIKPPTQGSPVSNWGLGHDALLLGEYYHATGDRNVLPYLKNLADWATMTQLKPEAETPEGDEAAHGEAVIGGWRHKYPTAPDRWLSGYGLLPHAGMTCVMGMELAKEAGLDVDERALRRGFEHFNKGRAEFGYVLYTYSSGRVDGPRPIDPIAEEKGLLSSMNGKLGEAAALFNLIKVNDTVEICSRKCVYAYNNTRGGHGGMFFGNFWTPIGAWAAGEKGFKYFMKGQTWWRELYRRSDGSFNQVGRGHIGVSYALPYVAPKQRLRMLGAPKSAFGTNCPEYLKPAIEAHERRDYALCEKLILEQIANVLPAEDMPVVNHLLDSVRILRASINDDLTLVETLIKDGKYYYASLELPQLKGVVAPDNPRLRAIEAALESSDGKANIKACLNVHQGEAAEMKAERQKKAAPARKEKWVDLIKQNSKTGPGDPWRMKVVETASQAPAGWTGPKFDDSSWNMATLPISWTMYHTALFRGTFTVNDPSEFDGLRITGKLFQQANVVVYLNGKLVAKIDEIGRGAGNTTAPLTDYAMQLLKKGENTIAISSRHKRRWGSFRGTYKTAATAGFELQASIPVDK